MRKLLFLILLLPAMAWGQLPSLNDTTLISPSTSFTPQWRYSLFGGDIIPQAYINGKYFFMPTNKYLSKYYASLNGVNSFTNTNTWAVGNAQGGFLTNGFYSLYSDSGLGGYALFQGNGSGGTNLTFLMRPDGNATDAFNRLQFNNTSVNITTPNGHGLEYSSAKAAFNPSDSSYVTKAWVRSRGVSDSTAIAGSYKLKSDSTGANGYQTQYRTDLRYLKLTGGTLSGNITAPTVNVTGSATSVATAPIFATIDGITGAVGKTAEVVSTNPLRANISPAVVSDLNTVTVTGLFYFSTSSTNIPFSSVGSLMCIFLNSTYGSQYAISRTGTSYAYRSLNNGVWSGWIVHTTTQNATYTYGATGTIYSTASGSITSAQLATSLTNETGSGVAVFDNAPSLTNPTVTTQAAGDNSTKAASTAYVDRIKYLRLTASGTGAATTISIAHGLTGVTATSIANVTPITSAASGTFYITTDATNINIVYAVAPVTGTNNLSYNIIIKP